MPTFTSIKIAEIDVSIAIYKLAVAESTVAEAIYNLSVAEAAKAEAQVSSAIISYIDNS